MTVGMKLSLKSRSYSERISPVVGTQRLMAFPETYQARDDLQRNIYDRGRTHAHRSKPRQILITVFLLAGKLISPFIIGAVNVHPR